MQFTASVISGSLTRVRSSWQDWWDSLKNEMGKQSFTEETMRDLYKDLFSSLGHHTSGQGTFHKKFLQVRRWFCGSEAASPAAEPGTPSF